MSIFTYLDETKLMALAAWAEASGEGNQGMQAIINVIQNRIKYPDKFAEKFYRGKYRQVILKPKQFSAFNFSSPLRIKLEKYASDFEYYLNRDKALQNAYDLAKLAKLGMLTDITKGALYYHTQDVKPYWSYTYTPVVQIRKHIFYKDKSLATPILISVVPLSIVAYLIYKYKRRY